MSQIIAAGFIEIDEGIVSVGDLTNSYGGGTIQAGGGSVTLVGGVDGITLDPGPEADGIRLKRNVLFMDLPTSDPQQPKRAWVDSNGFIRLATDPN